MISQLTLIDLKRALPQSGCPICRLQTETEERYLGHVLWEYVNDLSTRARFLPSWGYCARHARLLGRLELKDYHDAMGTAIMYESLVQQLRNQLDRVQAEAAQYHSQRRVRIFRMPWIRARNTPDPLAPTAGCYVCEIGTMSAGFILEGLIDGLEGREGKISELYHSSDGLCLPHLRTALTQTQPGRNAVSKILVDHAQKRMATLHNHISEYIRKHGWDARTERITPEEYASWRMTIGFFSGGLIEDVPRELAESNIQPSLK
jgi:hypothetical protein